MGSILRWCVRTYVRVRHALGMSECNAEECLGDVTRFRDPERIRNARAHALMSCPRLVPAYIYASGGG